MYTSHKLTNSLTSRGSVRDVPFHPEVPQTDEVVRVAEDVREITRLFSVVFGPKRLHTHAVHLGGPETREPQMTFELCDVTVKLFPPFLSGEA